MDLFYIMTQHYQHQCYLLITQKIILTAVESDHQDYYPTYEDILAAFVEYACLLPEGGELIYCADDKGASEAATIASRKRPDIKLVPYGTDASCVAPGGYRLSFGNVEGGRFLAHREQQGPHLDLRLGQRIVHEEERANGDKDYQDGDGFHDGRQGDA